MRANTVACLGCMMCNSVMDCARSSPRCERCQQSLPWIAAADDATFTDIVSSAPVPVLVDIGDGEGNERLAGTAAVHLAIERAGALKLVKVHNEASPNLVQQFAASSPTLLLIDHGRVLARHRGELSIATLRCWLDNAVSDQRTVSASPPVASSNTEHSA